LIDQINRKELAEKLKNAIEMDPVLRIQKGRELAAFVRKHYSIELEVQKHEKVHLKVIDGN
jgi:hypothetical protein